MSEDFDTFSEEEVLEESTPPVQISPALILNILTGLLLLGSLILGLVFLVIFFNPQSGINPLPPTTMPALFNTYTPSPTPKEVLPPTWTPTIAPPAFSTNTPTPSMTPAPPTQSSQSTPSSDNQFSDVSFVVAEDSPTYSENIVHEEKGCQWMGVAGQVFDTEGNPVRDILVTVKGTLGDEDINKFIFTGLAPEEYGEEGYEIVLSDRTVASQNSLYIQLLDQTDNLPLSDQIFFNTYDDCDRNLILINFVQKPNDQ